MMQHCIASQHALAMSFIAIFFFSQITCCNATPEAAQEDPQLDHRKQKLLETGYVYAGNINSPYPEGNMCNHTACDWDPLSGHVDPEHMKDSPIVSQAVLLDGSRYVRKEARLLNTALQEAMEVPVSHTTNIAKMNRKLLEVCGPLALLILLSFVIQSTLYICSQHFWTSPSFVMHSMSAWGYDFVHFNDMVHPSQMLMFLVPVHIRLNSSC